MSDHECIVGIVLRAMDYKETQRLITLFSPTGLQHLVVKNLSSKRAISLLASSPFAKTECIVKSSGAELLSCRDLSLVEDHSTLRTRYAYLHAAGALARALLHTQLPGKAAPRLYHLFETYLQNVVSFVEHAPLIASFLLKLLAHDGQLQLTGHCLRCENKPATMLLKGESLCNVHSHEGGISFSANEWSLLQSLRNARFLGELRTLSLPAALEEKVYSYFYGDR